MCIEYSIKKKPGQLQVQVHVPSNKLTWRSIEQFHWVLGKLIGVLLFSHYNKFQARTRIGFKIT